MKGTVGRQKGEPQTPLMRLAAERNWELMKLKGALATIHQVCMKCSISSRVELSLVNNITILADAVNAQWEKDKKRLRKEKQSGASETKKEADRANERWREETSTPK